MSNRPGAIYAGTITKKRSQATNTAKATRAAAFRQPSKTTRRTIASRHAARLSITAITGISAVESIIRAVQ